MNVKNKKQANKTQKISDNIAVGNRFLSAGNTKKIAVSLGLILLLTIVIYAVSINNGFAWVDDDENVSENVYIRDINANNIAAYFTEPLLKMYTPLIYLSYAVDYKIGGLNPRVYHLTNLILHLLNVCLVFFLIRLFSQRLEIAAMVALFFAIHPLNVGGVASVSMRGSLLYSLFYLAALISYILYLKGDYKRRYLVIAFFLYICSLLSKSAAVVLPLSMLAADYYLRRKIDFACIAEKVPFFLLSLGFGALTIYFREDAGHIWSPYAFTWLDNLFFISYAIWGYVYKLFLPINLSAFYGYPVKINGLLPATFYLSPLFLAVVIWCAHRAKKYRREIIFGILFFLVNIVLVVKIVPLGTEIACDRYVYIPHIGTLFILGCILSDLIRAGSKARIILFTLITIIVILLSVISYGRITVWKDAITRYDDILNNDPNVYMAYYNRAVAKKGVNDLYGALADYNRAIELYPNERIYDNRGNVKYDLKDYQGAMNDYTKSIEVQANNYAAYNNRANAKVKLQDYAGALADFNRALELYPAYADAYGNRAGLKALQGDIGGAISDYDKAINMNPNYDRAYFKRGNSRLALKDYEGAISDYSAALSLKPDADSYWNRGNAKIAVKDYAGAIADYEAALNYNPGNVSILFNLGWGRWLYGDKAGACADWNRAYEFGRKDTANVLKQFCVINR